MTDKELARHIIDRRPVACSECGGKLKYEGGGEYKCIECHEISYDEFGKVRKYLYDNGPSPAPEVVAATGVSNQIVIELLKEGRIELIENSKFFLRCEKCGCSIRYGRICPDCARRLADNLDQAMKESVGEKPKMKAYSVTDTHKVEQKMYYYNTNKHK